MDLLMKRTLWKPYSQDSELKAFLIGITTEESNQDIPRALQDVLKSPFPKLSNTILNALSNDTNKASPDWLTPGFVIGWL